MFTCTDHASATTCDGVTRRDFLSAGALSAIGLTLPGFAKLKAEGKVDPKKDGKSCIMIFNLGAPSQQDLWDMKPDAPSEVRGPFQPIRTKSDAFELSELLPLHAKLADKFSLVRSCHHDGAAVHDAGWQMMQTGRQFQGGVNTPHAGSVLSFLRGRRSDLPSFVVLPETIEAGPRIGRRQRTVDPQRCEPLAGRPFRERIHIGEHLVLDVQSFEDISMQVIELAQGFQGVVGPGHRLPLWREYRRHALEDDILAQSTRPGGEFGFELEAMRAGVGEEFDHFDPTATVCRLGRIDGQVILAGVEGGGRLGEQSNGQGEGGEPAAQGHRGLLRGDGLFE